MIDEQTLKALKNDAENIFEDTINFNYKKITFSKEQRELVIKMIVDAFTTKKIGENVKTLN